LPERADSTSLLTLDFGCVAWRRVERRPAFALARDEDFARAERARWPLRLVVPRLLPADFPARLVERPPDSDRLALDCGFLLAIRSSSCVPAHGYPNSAWGNPLQNGGQRRQRRDTVRSVRALLYDIHGNLPALEAVLADAGGVDEFVLGGDYAVAGAWPRDTVERLKALPSATWIRGNADRWLLERHDAPSPIDEIAARCAEALGDQLVDELSSLPESTTIDRTLYCHASPQNDMQSFSPEPADLDAELLMGVETARVVFGHTHLAFARRGPGGIELVNPGSVGMPWDGDHRAAYAVIDGDRVEQRRVEYDWEASVAAVRKRVGELPARRMELARFDVA